jgi:hypothetical protein
MSKQKQILGPLAGMMRRGFKSQKIPVRGGLEDVLSRVANGEAEALQELPAEVRNTVCNLLADAVEETYGKNLAVGAAVDSLRRGEYKEGVQGLFEATPVRGDGPVYGSRFFARDPAAVAKDLCGSALLYTEGSDVWSGVVTETAGYRGSTKKDKETAEASPGTIGVWNAQGHKILIASAHEPGKKGTVAVWGMGLPDEKWSMGEVGKRLEIDERAGEIIGATSDLSVMPRDPSSEKVGKMYVRSMPKAKGACAIYKLSR